MVDVKGVVLNKALMYPFDPALLMRKRKKLKRELEAAGSFVEKRIAVLGGSTTHDVVEMMELFLRSEEHTSELQSR